jgi:PAS domain-containing protein
MLLLGGVPLIPHELDWLITVFGQKLHPILRQQALTERDRKQSRERTLLYSIINAVTDPILLSDTEGRLLTANARALTLFTATEEESEGRRGAVRMNNMLLSSALSSKAIEETGAARRELLLVNPVDGSDLLFELLSTVTEDPRHGTGVVSILRNVSDLRRASEEIEENYRKLRLAEANARAESDRLNLIIDSVADPIVVTDGGRGDVVDERAGGTVVHDPGAGQLRRAAVGPVQRRALLIVHRRHAGQPRSAPRRRDRSDRSKNGSADAGRGHCREDSVRARRADHGGDHSSRSPRGD